jgi:hypothetical protein
MKTIKGYHLHLEQAVGREEFKAIYFNDHDGYGFHGKGKTPGAAVDAAIQNAPPEIQKLIVPEETVLVRLSKNSRDFLQQLAHRIHTQDNRATAKPYFFACEEVREYPTDSDYGYDRVAYFLREDPEGEYDSPRELREAHPDRLILDSDIREVHLKEHHEVSNIFLTFDGYKQHVAQNRHNLKEPRDFLYHAFRNPEMEGLFKAIQEFLP